MYAGWSSPGEKGIYVLANTTTEGKKGIFSGIYPAALVKIFIKYTGSEPIRIQYSFLRSYFFLKKPKEFVIKQV